MITNIIFQNTFRRPHKLCIGYCHGFPTQLGYFENAVSGKVTVLRVTFLGSFCTVMVYIYY